MIEIKNLGLSYGNHLALSDVSLHVEKGKTMVVCGPSGSGKSTLLRCINGLERFQSGEIFVDNFSVQGGHTDIYDLRARIGMVFQHFELYPHKTVLDNLILAPVKVRKMTGTEARKKAMAILEQVGIADQANKYPATLSGGQQQRAAIARALAMEPQVMLFDEPTSALDPEMIKEVLDVMAGLTRSGMTMVVVTHEMGFARRAADEIVFMDKGRIVEKNNTRDFFARPAHERLRQFLGRILDEGVKIRG
ncbi:amino acid ABC transporter ATP-binding protein [Desulfobacula phenolica]|uniref:Glutamate/aspartate transport system ATP-binding protein n=1 Tax=Desulfobacula phenolica TaxID=90732 RepID=A0A1H2FBJ3_9BACT|nr:amino acid ABC transporter ATP-binding protein [Desulfobacula phenolica]SDU04633.1 glutamate/aspartate transport system ATP-binding protein [Desulfobacula phenolica]